MALNTAKDLIKRFDRYHEKQAQKFEKMGLYLSNKALRGYHNIITYWIIGYRGCGKSVISVDEPISLKRKYGYDNVKFYYFRLSDLSIKHMLANKAEKAFDPILVERYNLDITTKGNIVFDHGKKLCEFYPLVSAGKAAKGVNLYDANFLNKRPIGKDGKPIKRFIYIILDEFLMAEGVEKKSVGDPLAQFKIFLESILRDQERLDYDAVKVMLLANAVSECASFMGEVLNFIPSPNDFGIRKLTRKHALVWNVRPNKAYLEKRKRSYTADIMDYDNDPNYTNIVQRDLSTIMPKHRRLIRVTQLIMFSKESRDWFCVYDSRYIRKYKNESVSKDIKVGMIRHIDTNFYPEIVKEVFDMYDARAYQYADIMSQASFSARMKMLKSK